jgi:uncharacterized protein
MQAYRSALVTGASSGIGASLARKLAARGCDVVLVARRTDRLAAMAKELAHDHGVSTEVLTADLTDPEQLRVVEERVADPARPVELVVNNAGFGSVGRFDKLPIDREVGQVNLNVLALVRLTHAALPRMVESGHGGVLNVSSVAGFGPSPGTAIYGATKAFVTSFSESLHAEVSRKAVHVTALCPGFTRTEYQEANGVDLRMPGLLWLDPDAVAEAGLQAVTAGRPICVPGLQYKPLPVAMRLLPRPLLRTIVARVWGVG